MSQKFLWPRKHEISCSLLKRSETNKKGSFHRDKKIEFSPVSKLMLFVLDLGTLGEYHAWLAKGTFWIDIKYSKRGTAINI